MKSLFAALSMVIFSTPALADWSLEQAYIQLGANGITMADHTINYGTAQSPIFANDRALKGQVKVLDQSVIHLRMHDENMKIVDIKVPVSVRILSKGNDLSLGDRFVRPSITIIELYAYRFKKMSFDVSSWNPNGFVEDATSVKSLLGPYKGKEFLSPVVNSKLDFVGANGAQLSLNSDSFGFYDVQISVEPRSASDDLSIVFTDEAGQVETKTINLN